MSEQGLTTLLCLATALLAGIVIGAEREQQAHVTFGGVRTFPLFALAGAIGALVGPWLLVVLGLGVSALVGLSYLRDTREPPSPDAADAGLGMSTEMAAMATFALGALTTATIEGLPVPDRLLLVGAGTTAVLGLLTLKRRLHAFVARVSKEDVYATVKLMLLAVVLLPLLPSDDLGPFGALNPRSIGLLVVLISGIGFAGYVAIRALGPRKGLGLTGLLGGLASSTAVTLSFSGRAKESPSLVNACAVAIVLASSTMFPRLGVELTAVSYPLAVRAAWALGAAAAVGLVAGSILYLRLSKDLRHGTEEPLELKNPFTLTSALKFAALFTVVLLFSRAAAYYFADAGVLVSAVVTGLADADAIALSVARMQAHGTLSMEVALLSVGLAAGSNTLSKIGLAFLLGGRALGVRVALPLLAALLAGGVALFLIPT